MNSSSRLQTFKGEDTREMSLALEALTRANEKSQSTFPVRKTLAYLIQLRCLIETDEISSLAEGRSIIITPDFRPQPQVRGKPWIEEQLILSVTGEFNQPQGDIRFAAGILQKLIDEIEEGSLDVGLEVLADKIKGVRKKIQDEIEFEQDEKNHNQEKLDTYLRTLEFNLRHYIFLQNAGVYYFGKDKSLQNEAAQESLDKEKLAKITSLEQMTIKVNGSPTQYCGRLLVLKEKQKSSRQYIMGYVHVFGHEYRYIPADQLDHYLSNASCNLTNAPLIKSKVQPLNAEQTKKTKEKFQQLMVKELRAIFSSIDTIHKIWVNSAPSNNPCAHELLMLSRKGKVIGYAHVNAMHDVLTYMPKHAFNDYLKRDNRTVMGMQKLHIRDMKGAQRKLIEYSQKKWTALGFLNNCANFVDEIAHKGGNVPLSEINPQQIGQYSFFATQYPIRRLKGVDEHREMHVGKVKEKTKSIQVSKQLARHISTHKESYVLDAIDAGLTKEEDQERYAELRHACGYSHHHALYQTQRSFLNYIRLQFHCLFKQPTSKAKLEKSFSCSEDTDRLKFDF